MKGQPKSSMGDASIVQNIHLLYVRAKRKWQEDLSWHLQHAEFAKQVKSYQMLSRIYAEALQVRNMCSCFPLLDMIHFNTMMLIFSNYLSK